MNDTKIEKRWIKAKDMDMHCPRCRESYTAVILVDEDGGILSIMYKFGEAIENGGQA